MCDFDENCEKLPRNTGVTWQLVKPNACVTYNKNRKSYTMVRINIYVNLKQNKQLIFTYWRHIKNINKYRQTDKQTGKTNRHTVMFQFQSPYDISKNKFFY